MFGNESHYRLPELALLAGNLLSYVVASVRIATGFWDRATCEHLCRALARVHSGELPVLSEQLRKKNSVTTHLKTGVETHRRTKAVSKLAAITRAKTKAA